MEGGTLPDSMYTLDAISPPPAPPPAPHPAQPPAPPPAQPPAPPPAHPPVAAPVQPPGAPPAKPAGGGGSDGWFQWVRDNLPQIIFLLVIGLLILLMFGAVLFDVPVLKRLSDPPFARGLITFLITVATIGLAFVLVYEAMPSTTTDDG